MKYLCFTIVFILVFCSCKKEEPTIINNYTTQVVTWPYGDKWMIIDSIGTKLPGTYFPIRALAFDKNNTPFLGGDVGIYTILNNIIQKKSYDSLINSFYYKYEFVNKILFSKNNELWLAGDPYCLTITPTEIKQNLYGQISDLDEDSSGGIWAISGGTTLYEYNSNSTVSFWDHTNSGLPNATLADLCIDSKGTKWMLTPDSGLVKMDIAGQVTIMTKWNSGLPNMFLNNLCIDKNDHLWLTTRYPANAEKVMMYDIKNDTWKFFTSQDIGIDPYLQSEIITDNKNRVWISCFGQVLMYDPTLNNWTSFKNTKYPLPDLIFNMACDKKGNIWFAGNMYCTVFNENGIKF